MSATPPGSGPRIVFTDNHDDPRSTVQYLHDLGMYRILAHHDLDYGRIVVRPTPGSTDRPALGLDVLLALGKNPHSVRAERLPSVQVWQTARAWLIGARITDMIVDRVHDLPVDRMHDLAELAAAVRATLWLIWSSPDTDAAHLAVKELTTAGHNVQRMWPNEVRAALPTPGHWWTADPPRWPTLPVADFTTFRAACRRHLSPREFARVDTAYRDSAQRTDRWMTEHYQDRYDPDPAPTGRRCPGAGQLATTRRSARPPTRPQRSSRCVARRPRCSYTASCCPGGPLRSARTQPPACSAT